MSDFEIDRDYLATCLHDLLLIPSPAGRTRQAVDYVEARMAELEIETRRSRRGNLHARLPGASRENSRCVAVHLDTLGAMVRAIRPDGRLALAPIGTWSSRFAEGARVTIFGHSETFRGTVLPEKSSGHIWNDAVDEQPCDWDHVVVRVDAPIATREDAERLGLGVGDFVAFDTAPEFGPNGFINARHLDDKAGVAAVLAATRSLAEATLSVDVHLLFTVHEEVGSGGAVRLDADVAELVAVDLAPLGPGQQGSELGVTLAAMDASGPFDAGLTERLYALAKREGIEVRKDVFRHYKSDVASALLAGNDVRSALVCFGLDSSHGYERTHIASLAAVARLLASYFREL